MLASGGGDRPRVGPLCGEGHVRNILVLRGGILQLEITPLRLTSAPSLHTCAFSFTHAPEYLSPNLASAHRSCALASWIVSIPHTVRIADGSDWKGALGDLMDLDGDFGE